MSSSQTDGRDGCWMSCQFMSTTSGLEVPQTNTGILRSTRCQPTTLHHPSTLLYSERNNNNSDINNNNNNNTAHCCGITWPHELGGPQVPGRPRSEDFACVWRRQGNYVFVSTHLFCYFVLTLFCCTLVLSWTTAGRAQDRESSPVKGRRSTTVSRNQPTYTSHSLN